MSAPTTAVLGIARKWKWFTVVIAPMLIALMIWGFREVVLNYLSGKGDPRLWITVLVLMVLGSMILLFAASVIWAFRARVTLDAEKIAVRGVFRTRVITARLIEGYRYINGQLHLYLLGRQWPVQLAYFEEQQRLTGWLFPRADNLDLRELDEEDELISQDPTLGITDEQKAEQLGRLRKVIRRLDYLAFATIPVAVANFLFLEHQEVARFSVAVLVLIPILLDAIGLANRGHVRVDYNEGTRYPQILTGTMACGLTLALMSLLDRGALPGNAYYPWLFAVTAAHGMLWLVIDLEGVRKAFERSGWVAILSVLGFFLLSAAWAGGAVYQVNKQFDQSPVTWHTTSVVRKKVAKGKTTSYRIEVAPWDESMSEPLEITLRRKEFQALFEGQKVEIGIGRGALEVPWVSAVRPRP